MGLALEAARSAGAAGEVPIGAVVLRDGEVLAVAGNQREGDHDPTAHAEVVALRHAADLMGSWRLSGTELVVTLEPCAMCAGALLAARVDRVVFGAADLRFGAVGSRYDLLSDPRLNHEIPHVGGVRAEEASALLRDFFSERR